MTKQQILDEFNDINYVYNNSSKYETLSMMLDELLKGHEERIEDVPENDEWALEDTVYNSLTNEKPIKYPCGQYQTCDCGLDLNQSKYKEDCYFYGETKDMGATIRYCTQSEIKWGYCPCEECDKYISNAEASKIIRKYVKKGRRKQNEIWLIEPRAMRKAKGD